MFILPNSATGRPSSTATGAPAACRAASARAVMRGVWQACSTSSPKVLDGRFTPANSV